MSKISILFFVCIASPIFGQIANEPLLSNTFVARELVAVINEIDSSSSYDIFFQKSDLPEKKISLNCNQKSISACLIEALIGTNLEVHAYRDFAYVILKKEQASENLQALYLIIKSEEEKLESILNKIEVGTKELANSSRRGGVSGTVRELKSGLAAIGVELFFGTNNVAVTDANGTYKIDLDYGAYNLKTNYSGFQSHQATLQILSDGQYDITLSEEVVNLDEVVITTIAKDASVRETQTGVNKINLKQIEKLPTFFGEKDILKGVLLNSGVSSIGEGASGFNVRGGNVDQNLIMQDEAIIFNSSHALGLFSMFNTDLTKEATLVKGNLPATQGGRTASSLEVNLKDGNHEKFLLKGSFNPVSATLSFDGPLSKSLSVIGGVRSTFSNYIFNFFSDVNLKNTRAGFYDVNFKINYKKDKNNISLAAYKSNDNFKYSNKFGFDYSTQFAQFNWNRIFNNTRYNKLALIVSSYDSRQLDYTFSRESELGFNIKYARLVNKYTIKNEKSKFEMGLNSIAYFTTPGKFRPLNNSSVLPKTSNLEKGIESALFFNSEFNFSKWIDLIAGVRVNHFGALDKIQNYEYVDNVFAEKNISGVSRLDGLYQNYFTVEPRSSLKISLSKSFSLKLGYARMSQFITQIFNGDTPAPNSYWQMANNYIKPTISDNYSVGLFKNFSDNNYEFSVEVYRRNADRIYDYRDFASLVVNPHIETELVQGKGISQGLEVSMKKNEGLFNGWLTYTYARSLQQIGGINQNAWYPTNYDKPHNLNVIFNYQPIKRKTFTANFTFSTGRPTTPPFSNYLTPDNVYVPIYPNRNQARVPDYHRLDLSYNMAKSNNKAAKIITSWTFVIYNVYGRRNPFSVFYTRGLNDVPQANRLSVIGTTIPAIRFNIEFN